MKILRKSLKTWAKTLSNLKDYIFDTNTLIPMIDAIDNIITLTTIKFDFRRDPKAYLSITCGNRGEIK